MEKQWDSEEWGGVEAAMETALSATEGWAEAYGYRSIRGERAWEVLGMYAARWPESISAYFFNNCTDEYKQKFISVWNEDYA